MSQQKRRTGRAPAILRGIPAEDRPASVPEHGVRNPVGVSWRAVSGLIVVVLAVVLVVFFVTDYFYVRSVIVVGTEYLDEREVFRYANIAEQHIFWIDPVKVRQSILDASPVIADARIIVSWPPDLVKIFIEEREPALIWVQSGVTALVDLQGRVLRYPPDNEPRPDLIQVIVDNSLEGPPGVDQPIPQDAINGALQLRTLLAGITVLRYNAVNGLGFREPNTQWDVWLGTGADMNNKLAIYEALRDNLQARGIIPLEINVADPEATYYCRSIEDCR